MRFLPFVWATLWRRKLRTTFTLLAIVTAFLLYGLLETVATSFANPVDDSAAGQLLTMNRYSLGLALPLSQLDEIRRTPGVKDATMVAFFGGWYREPRNVMPAIAVDPEAYFRLYGEAVLPQAARVAFASRRDALVAGVDVARKYGWQVGDRVTLHSTTWPLADGSSDWSFEIVGLMDGRDAATRSGQANAVLLRYDYFDEARAFGKGSASWFVESVDHPERAADVGARIDARFANSPDETSTRSAKEFARYYLQQLGDVTTIVRAILGAVFFTLLMLTANTMRQSVRERTGELATLKALGFGDGLVMALVVGESVLLCTGAAVIGLGLSWLALPAVKSGLQGMALSPRALLPGLADAVLLALVTSVLPGARALRLNVADALAGKR